MLYWTLNAERVILWKRKTFWFDDFSHVWGKTLCPDKFSFGWKSSGFSSDQESIIIALEPIIFHFTPITWFLNKTCSACSMFVWRITKNKLSSETHQLYHKTTFTFRDNCFSGFKLDVTLGSVVLGVLLSFVSFVSMKSNLCVHQFQLDY